MSQSFEQIEKVKLEVIEPKSESEVDNRKYYLFFFLYFLQGTVLAIANTMPYLYPQLPPYTTLALFNIVDLPFSLKFIMSPFLEKYTNFSYGKRKTWIVVSQFTCFFVLIMASGYTQYAFASVLAILLLFSQLLITVQDISLDSLSIKQIRCPEKTTIVQSVAQTFGTVVGSLILLKLTSTQFASKVGFEEPITTPQRMIQWVAFFLMVSSIMMHFLFKQTDLDCQRQGKQKTICEIISYSQHFFKIRSKYCRFGLFLLIYYQGFNFYEAGYDYQMVKAGFSRDTSNTISNIISGFILALTLRITQLITKYGVTTSLKIVFFGQGIIYLFNIIIFSQSPYLFSITQLLSQILQASGNMVIFIFIYQFPLHGFTGMFITIFVSIWNFGTLTTFSTLVIHVLGWRICAFIGVVLQLLFVFTIDRFFQWIENGTLQIDKKSTPDQEETSLSSPQQGSLNTFVQKMEQN